MISKLQAFLALDERQLQAVFLTFSVLRLKICKTKKLNLKKKKTNKRGKMTSGLRHTFDSVTTDITDADGNRK